MYFVSFQKGFKRIEKCKSLLEKHKNSQYAASDAFPVRRLSTFHFTDKEIPQLTNQTGLCTKVSLSGRPQMSSSGAGNSQTAAQPAGELRLQGGLLGPSYLGL